MAAYKSVTINTDAGPREGLAKLRGDRLAIEAGFRFCVGAEIVHEDKRYRVVATSHSDLPYTWAEAEPLESKHVETISGGDSDADQPSARRDVDHSGGGDVSPGADAGSARGDGISPAG